MVSNEQLNTSSEWFIANGLGGYACGSISGVPQRRYHSLLNAALPAPFGRMVMLNYVADSIIIGQEHFPLSHLKVGDKKEDKPTVHFIEEFRFRKGVPTWKYKCGDIVIEKNIFLIHRQNTVCISYFILEAPGPVELHWRPYFHFRMNEQPVNVEISNEGYSVQIKDTDYEIQCPNLPPLRIYNSSNPSFTFETHQHEQVFYEIEAKRGYASVGKLTSPGYFTSQLIPNERTSFMVSTESWDAIKTMSAADAWRIEKWRKRNLLKTAGPIAKDPLISQLTLAADQFIFTPVTRYRDMVRLYAAGEEIKSIIAGYPWFTDWGRDTMISFEGLTLSTGRHRDAYTILHTFSHYVKDGLLPNMFPEGENKGLYNTADATLWYFHAIDRYVEVTGDSDIVEFLLPKLREIIDSHIRGTRFGIHMDEDGLLIQGEENFALTWMDAKMGDWIVTPRRGKAVEINALWYNALRLYENWTGKKLEIADKCYASFNEKFWYAEGGYLYDVIEGENGNDHALRPNQILAISLKYPVLKPERWNSVVDIVHKELVTSLGLRTLASHHPEYKAYYNGDLLARDASYHQGTVWPWLIGPFIDAWLKVHPNDQATARKMLEGMCNHLNSDCLGTIGEIFDSAPPHHARGCFAQAWSVAELLRCLIKTH